jgi:hypothetical protein
LEHIHYLKSLSQSFKGTFQQLRAEWYSLLPKPFVLVSPDFHEIATSIKCAGHLQVCLLEFFLFLSVILTKSGIGLK